MSAARRVALVTGGNRGIGRETCRRLAAHGLDVVLTSRGRGAGEAAARELGVRHHALDVTDTESAEELAGWLGREVGRLDVLVNNAGIMPDRARGGPSLLALDAGVLRQALETNTLGAVLVSRALVPLMRRAGGGRIVNVSSGLGQLDDMGAGTPAYRISKTALNAVTRILAAELEPDTIKVNSACPGWVRTDIGGPRATRSVEEGADTIVWLATLPADGPTGGFFRDRAPIPW